MSGFLVVINVVVLLFLYLRFCKLLEFLEEARGSVHYITEDGRINYLVILKAVSQVMINTKEHDIGTQVSVSV